MNTDFWFGMLIGFFMGAGAGFGVMIYLCVSLREQDEIVTEAKNDSTQ
jgi:hypothetical protein